MLHKNINNDIGDIICYGFIAIIIFAVLFPLLFPINWLLVILGDDDDPIVCECFTKLFSPKFWYNFAKDATHDNFK